MQSLKHRGLRLTTAFSTPKAAWGHHQLFLIQMALTTAMSEAKIEMIAG